MPLFNGAIGAIALALLLSAATATAAAAQQLGYDPMQAMRGVPPAGAEVAVAAPPNPEFDGLPDAPGVEETYYQCVACHSTAIIKQQRLTDERWDYLWTWMVEHQGMYEPDEETKEVILGYLKQNFSAER